jgi:hypothetical protein
MKNPLPLKQGAFQSNFVRISARIIAERQLSVK